MTAWVNNMKMNDKRQLPLFLSYLALLFITGGFTNNKSGVVVVDAASKIKRVKAGRVYQDHDDVHIVVEMGACLINFIPDVAVFRDEMTTTNLIMMETKVLVMNDSVVSLSSSVVVVDDVVILVVVPG